MRGVWAPPKLLANAKSAENERRHDAEVRDLTRPGPKARRILRHLPVSFHPHFVLRTKFDELMNLGSFNDDACHAAWSQSQLMDTLSEN